MAWTLGSHVVDVERGEVRGPEGVTPLTPQESSILRVLWRAGGRFVSRQALLHEVWGFTHAVPTRAVDHAVSRLRAKIEPDPTHPTWLTTARGLGYRLEPPEAERDPPVRGRDLERRALDRALTRPALVVLAGPPGIGTSALARSWAREVGATFVTLDDDADAIALADAVDVHLSPACPPEETTRRVVGALVARGVTRIVLDQSGPSTHAAEGQSTRGALWPLVQALRAARIGVVVTAHEPEPWPTAIVHTLAPVSLETARTIFLESWPPGAAPPDPSALEDVLVRLDGIPLAIRMAAARASEVGIDALRRLLDDPDPRSPSRALPAVARAFESRVSRLPPVERRVLEAINRSPEGATLDVLAACTGSPPHEVTRARDLLRTCGLLRPGGTAWPLLARILDARADPAELASWGTALLSRWHDPESDRRPPRSELVRAAARLALDDPSLAARLLIAVVRAMLLRGPRVDAWAEDAVTAAERSGDPSLLTEALVLRGAVHTLAGRLEAAARDLQQAIAGPEPMATEARVRFGWWALRARGPVEAIPLLEQARDRARDLSASRIEALAEVRLASAWHRHGRSDLAMAHLQGAVGLFEGLGDEVEVARCRSSLAMMHVARGDAESARGPLRHALAVDRRSGVVAAVPQHLLNLGEIELLVAAPEAAHAALTEAATQAGAFGDEETRALATLYLGVAAAMSGATEDALRRMHEARVRLQEVHHPVGIGLAWAFVALTTPDPGASADAQRRAASALAGSVAELAALSDLIDAARRLPDRAHATAALARTERVEWSFVQVARRLVEARLATSPAPDQDPLSTTVST